MAAILQKAEKAYYTENWDESLAHYEALLKLDSNHFHSLKQTGRIYLERKGDYQSAEYSLKRALNMLK